MFDNGDSLIGRYCKYWFIVYKNPLQVAVRRLGISLGSFKIYLEGIVYSIFYSPQIFLEDLIAFV